MIVFRHLTDNLPPYWQPIHWQVEFYPDKEETGAPWGIAWVIVCLDPPPGYEKLHPIVEYVLVRDEHRRRGVAKAILKAVFEKWPDTKLTDAISPAGEALLNSVDP